MRMLEAKHRPEPVDPLPDRLVANVDAAFERQVLNVAQRQREADVQHHHELDHLRRAVEPAERVMRLGFAGHTPRVDGSAYRRVHLS